ncbi:MAG TPA: zinc-binding dehydrogenase [Spirochaetia bacterium]|nr:zinc-binding dehydrogenase [Spirochaetia bacterium]
MAGAARAVIIPRFGGPEVLRVVEMAPSPLAPESLRIQVGASGINFADVQMRLGLYPEAPKLPFVPGFEIAGTVTEVGTQAAGFRPGDRVLGFTRFGGYTTEIVVPAAYVRRTPSSLTDVEAAAIPAAFATAWISLMDMARVRSGDRVLVPGAAGGVGSAMVQVAACAGAFVVGLAGNPAKKEFVLSLGAGEALTYAEWERLGRSGPPEPFDVVLEPRGGSSVRASLAVLAPGGRVVCYGVSSMVTGLKRSIPRALAALLKTPLLTPIGLAMSNQGIYGVNLLKYFDTARSRQTIAEALGRVLEGFEKGTYRSTVGKTWPLEEAGRAHAFLQSREATGKQVLLLS